VIVMDDKRLMQDLCGYQGSKALLFCIDYNRIVRTAEFLGFWYEPDGLTAFITGAVDTSLAAQTASLAAKSLGIDSLFTNGIHRQNIRQVYERLNLPDRFCFPLIMLILGYPAEETAHETGRLTGTGVMHHNGYQTLTHAELERIVQKYDDPASHLALSDAWQKSGDQHYLDWFFKFRVREKNTEKEQELLEILKTSGFLPDC
ncbi:MAG: nitroreductase family protein, partial [Anaerolineaceae bacterium]